MRRAMAESGRAGGSGRSGEGRGWCGFVVAAHAAPTRGRCSAHEPEDDAFRAGRLQFDQVGQEVFVEEFAVGGFGAVRTAAALLESQGCVVVEGEQFFQAQPGMHRRVAFLKVRVGCDVGADIRGQAARFADGHDVERIARAGQEAVAPVVTLVQVLRCGEFLEGAFAVAAFGVEVEVAAHGWVLAAGVG